MSECNLPAPASGPVESYLDELFDTLAGSGRAGRRALAEVEDHLRAVTDDGVARGLSRADAEWSAVTRFGSAGDLAGAVIAVAPARPRVLLSRLLGAAWLVGAVGLVSVGLSGLLAWLVADAFGNDLVAPDAPGTTFTAARCADLREYHPQAPTCLAASIAHHTDEVVTYRLAAGVLGVAALVAFLLARRGRAPVLGRLRSLTMMPPGGVVAAAAVTLFGGVGAILVGVGADQLMIGQRWGAGTTLVSGAAALLAGTVFAPTLLRDLRLRLSTG